MGNSNVTFQTGWPSNSNNHGHWMGQVYYNGQKIMGFMMMPTGMGLKLASEWLSIICLLNFKIFDTQKHLCWTKYENQNVPMGEFICLFRPKNKWPDDVADDKGYLEGWRMFQHHCSILFQHMSHLQ